MKILFAIGIFLLYLVIGILIIAIIDRITPLSIDADDFIMVGISILIWPVMLLIWLFAVIGVIGGAVLKAMRNRGIKKKGQE